MACTLLSGGSSRPASRRPWWISCTSASAPGQRVVVPGPERCHQRAAQGGPVELRALPGLGGVVAPWGLEFVRRGAGHGERLVQQPQVDQDVGVVQVVLAERHPRGHVQVRRLFEQAQAGHHLTGVEARPRLAAGEAGYGAKLLLLPGS